MDNQQEKKLESAKESAKLYLQRIYVRDLSFESPQSPAIFTQKWNPSVALNFNTDNRDLDENLYEVILSLSVTVKNFDKVTFIVEVQQAGIFYLEGKKNSKDTLLNIFCPNTLFPYARESIDSLVTRGGFPALMLSPINFSELYSEKIKK